MTSTGGIYDTPLPLSGPCSYCGVYYTGFHDCAWTRQPQAQPVPDPALARIADALERIAQALEYPR